MEATIQLERILIGACCLEKTAFRRVRHLIQPDELEGEHQRIWQTMCDMDDKGFPIDLELVIKELGGQKDIRIYINEIANTVASSANLEYYCQVLIDFVNRKDELKEAAMIQHDPELLRDLDFLKQRAQRMQLSERRMLRFKKALDINSQIIESLKRIEAAGNTEGLTGVDTGSHTLNAMTGGFQRGAMVVLAARPGMGKTHRMIYHTINACQKNHSVYVATLEMTSHELMTRMISYLTGIDSNNLKTSEAKNQDWDAIHEATAEIGGYALTIDDRPALTLHQIAAAAAEHKRKYGAMDLICIDYIGLIEPFAKRYSNRYEAVTDISKGIKRLAKEFDTPVLALSQLSRDVEKRGDHRPKDADLRDSGSIEQDSDIIMFLYRPRHYFDNVQESEHKEMSQDEFDHYIEVIISKHRAGDTGILKEYVDLSTGRFSKRHYTSITF